MGREPHRLVLTLAVVAVAGLLASCGAGGDEAAEPTAPAPSTTSSTASTLPMLPTTSTTFVDPAVEPPVPVADPGPPPGANSVFVLGDSVLVGGASSIPVRLADWLVTYDAAGNRRLAQGVDVLTERRGEIGEAVVIQLGNNYIPGERDGFRAQLDEAMTVLADVPRVVWVTVAEVNPGRDEVNRVIRDAPSRYGNAFVADWSLELFVDPSLTWDGLHLTPSGRVRMADLIARTLGPVTP